MASAKTPLLNPYYRLDVITSGGMVLIVVTQSRCYFDVAIWASKAKLSKGARESQEAAKLGLTRKIQRKKIHPKKFTQNKKVHLNEFL